ncbi:branched-chain amino acid transport system II carrier protein [Mesobacillus maritimus]|uniref:branched-chain amino acid transport system II carrier protein n=1 Tax=Mesobacillus maritimus TaxID=1643336 RepID=UPI00204237E5|nr:branched-chain amino acid transport system II carrier protein [Mesobacillus maritimus]MCM3585631.1 branched-chain amino acid transport system II carrier protein [Mesobacillus maritimus]MCM3669103.1 branched-chain amino acid transport system II carrier protein [Mesobacillus maritimus]
MRKFDHLFIGLMLFSMFFGAGNLIFPPFLGALSGTSYWLAMSGFILTAVGLPFIVLFAISRVKGGIQAIGDRVHPVFSTIFMVIVYLSIGPFLAIPRNANVAFEMGIMPFANGFENPTLVLLFFSVVFFLFVYLISLNPTNMEKYLGRWITPILLISIVALCVIGLGKLDGQSLAPRNGYESGAFFKGFIEGYNTMDALAALAFGIVILTAVQKKGVKDEKKLTGYMLKAALIAGSLLAAVYVFLGMVGGRMAALGTFENGTQILSSVSTLLFGQSGTVLLGVIFTLACFTTVVGLTSACGQYFSNLIPWASYRSVILVVTLIGFTLTNMGLNQILKVSVPFLVTAYPLTIVLIVLTFFNHYFKGSRIVYVSAMFFTGFFAVISGLSSFGINLGFLENLRSSLPFSSVGLEWVIPAVVGTLVGVVITKLSHAFSITETPRTKAS